MGELISFNEVYEKYKERVDTYKDVLFKKLIKQQTINKQKRIKKETRNYRRVNFLIKLRERRQLERVAKGKYLRDKVYLMSII